ncbi:MAG: acylneuraminate cytidylyltransferase family protein [Verrucomicrobiota bacterium]
MKKIICTVCVRGGSKGVPGKNIRPMLGVPLLQHTLNQAVASGIFAAIAVSSDSQEILDCATQVPGVLAIQRPNDMATDTAGKVPAIRHAMLETERMAGITCEILVDLDVTSPLRDPEDIRNATALISDSVPNVLTAMHSRRSPYFNLLEKTEEGEFRTAKRLPGGVLRRQDAPQCYDMNASIYVWRREVLEADTGLYHPGTAVYVMPEERSWDIDSEMDWAVVELLMKRKHDKDTDNA